MKECVSDIETDGLLDELTKFYCGCIQDVKTEEVFTFTEIGPYLEKLNEYDTIWFHNGIPFDYPALQKLYGPNLPVSRAKVRDTLVVSRLIYANISDIDTAKRRKFKDSYKLPGKLTGSHSLKAWGYRLGDYKGDFDPADYTNPETGEPHTWKTVGFSQEMLDYNIQDCAVTLRLLRALRKKQWLGMAIEFEEAMAWLMAQQERNGFHINVSDAVDLYAELQARKKDVEEKLKDTFGWWYASNGEIKPKRTINYKEVLRPDLIEGARYTKLKVVEFNPGSRKHGARCFKKWYDWEPSEFTDSGEPKLDAETLELLPFKEAPLLAEYYDIAKMLGQIGDGKNAWLKLEKNGVIHGSVNPNGASTGRASHSKPNMAQVKKGKPGSYGYRCRQLFTVPAGWVLLGTDASGLELRCLGNALAPYDGGAYAELVINGDVHWVNTLALGLVPPGTERDKHNPEHEAARDASKTWIYAFLYGAGNELLGAYVGYTDADVERWRKTKAHLPIVGQMKRRGERPTRHRVCNILKGAELRKRFLKAIPAVKDLQSWAKEQHLGKKRGDEYIIRPKKYIKGLDGRIIHTRSGHSATNFKLQGDGAVVCKAWGVLIEEMTQKEGLKHGWDGDYAFCAWVHDEYQIACRTKEIAHTIGEIAKRAIRLVGERLKFACQLDADYDIGLTWAETH